MKKTSLLIIILVIMIVGLIGCSNTTQDQPYLVKNAYVTLDINPSVEIITDEEGLVEQVNALNEDAQVLLEGSDFVGRPIDEVVEDLMQLALELGYLDFDVDNAILVTTASDDLEDLEDLDAAIEAKVQNFVNQKQIRIDLIRAQFEDNEAIQTLAEELGISVGKVKLITYAMAFDETITYETAAEMSVRDLNRIIVRNREETKEFVGEEVMGAYAELKEEQRLDFVQERATLLNTAIQAAADDVFTELLAGTTTTPQMVKELYQAYTDTVLGIELTVEPVEPVETEDPEVSPEEQLATLSASREEIRTQIETLVNSLMDEVLDTTARDAIIEQLRGLRTQFQGIAAQIEALRQEGRDHHPGVGIGGEFSDGMKHEVLSSFITIRKDYQEQFQLIGVDLETLEELFAEGIHGELETIRDAYKVQIDALKESMKEQMDIIRDQIREEHDLLKEVWDQGHRGDEGKQGDEGNHGEGGDGKGRR